jgi:hypothetical protein
VYAPRYRQANGTAFSHPSADGDRALALVYEDVRRAFDAFHARRGPGRPFLLASHSQGSVLAERLLREAISGTPLRDRLVAAAVVADGRRACSAGAEPRRRVSSRATTRRRASHSRTPAAPAAR